MALAPNSNSSILLGVTPGNEPPIGNIFNHSTRAGNDLVIEEHFGNLIEEIAERQGSEASAFTEAQRQDWVDDVFDSVMEANGSVAHLPFLSDHEKKVFKTAFEIDQNVLVDLAAERQQFICQGQSFNLFIPPYESKKKFNEIHFSAWEKGLKGLYYLRTQAKFKTTINCFCQN